MTAEEYFKRANQKAEQGKYQEAIVDYSKAIDLDPKYTKAFSNRGLAKANLKQFDEAIADYNQAIDLKPEDETASKIFSNRGLTKANLKQYDEAIADYNQAIDSNPEDATAFYNRGRAKRELGEEKEALKDFKKAQELDPTIISKETIEQLQKEFAEKIQQTQESNKKVLEFTETLRELRKEYKTDEKIWFRFSWISVVIVGIIIIVDRYCWVNIIFNENLFKNPLLYFFITIIFIIIRQYTSAKKLRIEASNRLAMAQMFETINRKQDQEYKKFLDKIVDSIVYSTMKENKDTSTPENIKSILDYFNKAIKNIKK